MCHRHNCLCTGTDVSCYSTRAFAAKAPEKILETVQAWGNQYNAVIEEDQVVTINTNN